MPLLIDTNIAVYLTDGREEVKRRIAALSEPPVMSLISLVELEGGINSSKERAGLRRARLDALLRFVAVLPFDRAIVTAYSDIVTAVGYSRKRLLDRLIAATAIVAELTVATSNGPDFADIPGLNLEVWPRPGQ